MATDSKKSSKPKNNNNNNNNKKRQRYLPHNRAVKKKGAYPLKPGVQGFFITCDGGKEYQSSQEAIQVLDSFLDELVQGIESTTEHVGLMKKPPMNKKIKFESSDSSGSDEDDDDEKNGGDGDADKKDGDAADNKDDDDKPDGSVVNTDLLEKKGEISCEKQIQETEENKEEEKEEKKQQEVEAEEPPMKKQCLESVEPRCENIPSRKVEQKSVDKLIEEELAELGDRSKRCFSNLDTGCNGVVFVQMRKKDGDPSPKAIVQHMMTSLAKSKKHVSRFILRVLPVEVSCYASEEEIMRVIKPLVSQFFPEETETPHKYSVLYDARANTGIDRMKIIDAVAKSIPEPHKVDLSNPDINIVVQVVKTVCLIGVVEKYKELAKYNLRQLTSQN